MRWDNETIFNGGDSLIQSMISDIKKAKKSIYLESYTYNFDKIGTSLLKNLEAAAMRGVKVYLLLDGIGSFHWREDHIAKMKMKGIIIKIYNPTPFGQIKGNRGLFKNLKSLFNLNKRNHRKACIIDSRVGYVSSVNVSDEHFNCNPDGAWRDTGVRVQGESVRTLKRALKYSWQNNWGISCRYQKSEIVNLVSKQIDFRLNVTSCVRKQYQTQMIKLIRQAKKRIWITTPYFVPDEIVRQSLCLASERGVDVKILLPKKSDWKYFPLINFLNYKGLIQRGVEVYEYWPSMLHAKIYMMDDWTCLGSSNLNYRSFYHDLELDIIVHKRRSKRILEQQFIEDLRLSSKLQLSALSQRFRPQLPLSPLLRAAKYFC